MKRIKIAVFFGTRPEAIKLAPVIRALAADPRFEVLSVSTGQHREMLKQVVDIFGIPIDIELDVMEPNQTLAGLSSRLMSKIDEVLEEHHPDFAVVQGDTTTVLMAALACFYRNIPVGHVEAGLRTRNMRSPFPEEANRVLASHLCSLHFAPTTTSRDNLIDDKVAPSNVYVTGNTVIDALQIEVAKQQESAVAQSIEKELAALLPADWRKVPFVLITGHRRENFGGGFQAICDAIIELAQRFPRHRFVYPVHLNPNVREPVTKSLSHLANVFLLPPLSYRPFVALMKSCHFVLTDSGGVQEEAPGIGKPVLVMRDTTERPEGVQAGTVRLVGANRQNIVDGVSELIDNAEVYEKMATANNPYGDGNASKRIVDAIGDWFCGRAENTREMDRR
jgi:UDP-N-acetylglucosamine 2-epimerase (non-hydrolysing)